VLQLVRHVFRACLFGFDAAVGVDTNFDGSGTPMERVLRKLADAADGDRQMVDVKRRSLLITDKMDCGDSPQLSFNSSLKALCNNANRDRDHG
jgi:hypothetical protein